MNELAELTRRANVAYHPSDDRLVELNKDVTAYAKRNGKTVDQVWDEILSNNNQA